MLVHHRDRELKRDLDDHLSALRIAGKIAIVWSDDEITAGTEFDPRIRAEMLDAKIILLLLSASYLASSYCWLVEAQLAFERHEEGEARVVPVLMRPVNWEETDVKKYSLVPRNLIPVTLSPNKDEALREITWEISRVIDELMLKDGRPLGALGPAAADDDERFYCEPICDGPVVVRSNSMTELLPDLVLRFRGDPGDRRVVDILLYANTNITSRLIGHGGSTEATLSLATGRCVTRIPTLSRGFRGRQRSVNSLAFLHVPLHELRLLDPPDRNLRISNVRVNAAQLGFSSSALQPTQGVVFISVTDTPVREPQRGIVTVLPNFDFRLTHLHDPIDLRDLVHGKVPNASLSGNTLATKRLTALLTFSGALADNGPIGERARLLVRFSGVPPDMMLYLTTQQVSASPSDLSSTLAKATPEGGGPFEKEGSHGYVELTDKALALHRLDTQSGFAHAAWELDGFSTYDSQEITLGVVVVSENRPEYRSLVSRLVVYGDLAPLSTDFVASGSAPIPRFATLSQPISFTTGHNWTSMG